MYITRAKYEEICKKYNMFSLLDLGAVDALNFVQDLLEAEVLVLKEREPHATASIERLEVSAYEVASICNEINNDEFNYGQEIEI